MREVDAELKALRLHGMASAWADLVAQGTLASLESSRWLIEHLLQAETTHRVMRSVSYQMSAAKFPAHRDLAGFDFASSKVDRALIEQLADLIETKRARVRMFRCILARRRSSQRYRMRRVSSTFSSSSWKGSGGELERISSVST
jgi:DNA replication protein DnaC